MKVTVMTIILQQKNTFHRPVVPATLLAWYWDDLYI